jgi:hypothetical protein
MWKNLTSPIMYGSNPKTGLKVLIVDLMLKDKLLEEISDQHVNEFTQAIETAVYRFLNIPLMIDHLNNQLLANDFVTDNFKYKLYRKYTRTTKIKVVVDGKKQFINYVTTKKSDKLNFEAMKRGILPNYIHSYEAAILHKLIRRHFDIIGVTIHDSV